MRPPRSRPTVRRLMIVVAVVAGLITLGRMVDRRLRFGREATRLAAQARYQTARAGRYRTLAKTTPGRASDYEDSARACDQRAAYSGRLADLWRDAANHPWRAEPRPELEPE